MTLTSSRSDAINRAQALADENGCPCAIAYDPGTRYYAVVPDAEDFDSIRLREIVGILLPHYEVAP